MAIGNTSIPYLEKTFHPVTGCSGDGCKCKADCWAADLIRNRLAGTMKGLPEGDPFAPTFHEDRLGDAAALKRPTVLGLGFFGDLLDKAHADAVVRRVIGAMVLPHTYVLTTKQAYRLPDFQWPDNAVVGVSCCDQDDADARLHYLRACSASRLWVSLEPLIGLVTIYPATAAEWGGRLKTVVVGGEHKAVGARPMLRSWLRSLRDQCQDDLGAHFVLKQGSGAYPKHFPELDGVVYDHGCRRM